jgi:2-keto-4-pentenoate hydratase/2-oxohepta-3-ene-1,7-dioic acid hydratase in catechol pathway
MKVFRIMSAGKIYYATREGDNFKPLNAGSEEQLLIPSRLCETLPVVVPTKIICVALNYKEHARELGMTLPEEPSIFMKPPSAIIGDNDTIILPKRSTRVDYEAELGIVIGKTGMNIATEEVSKHIFGYTCANDVTARDLQKDDPLFVKSKGFNTFCPIGPCIETGVADPGNLSVRTIVNGELKQSGNTSDMIHSPFELVSYISGIMTLYPGDLILTGTPPGIGPMSEGDVVQVEIEGVGTLTSTAGKKSTGGSNVQ